MSSPARYKLKLVHLKYKKTLQDEKIYCQDFSTLIWLSVKSRKKKTFYEKTLVISEVEHKYGKKEFPCGGWTPCPSKPNPGNVTTGLQGDSLNSLENVISCHAELMSFLKRFFPTDMIWFKRSWKKDFTKKHK